MFNKKQNPAVDEVKVGRMRRGQAASSRAVRASAFAPLAWRQARKAATEAAAADAADAGMRSRILRAAGQVGRPRLEEAYLVTRDRVVPVVGNARNKARDTARPYLDQAVGRTAPRVQGAIDTLPPKIDAAHAALAESLLPKVSAAIAAAVAATVANHEAEAPPRRARALALRRGSQAVVQPQRKGRILLGLGLVAGIGAAVATLANRKRKDDPWATPADVSTSSTRGLSQKVSGAKEKVTDVAGTAAHKVTGAAGTATGKAKEVGSGLADKVPSTITSARQRGKANGDTSSSDSSARGLATDAGVIPASTGTETVNLDHHASGPSANVDSGSDTALEGQRRTGDASGPV